MWREAVWVKKSHLACSKETSPSGPELPKEPGTLRAASFVGRVNSTVPRERDRAEVSCGSLSKSCSLAELIVS